MIPRSDPLIEIINRDAQYPPDSAQMEEFLHYVERLRGRYLHYMDRFQKNPYNPPFLFSGREGEFELLWLAYHMAHLCISCAPGEEQAPMRTLFHTVALYRTFDPPEELRRRGIRTVDDLLKIDDPRIQYGLSYLFGTGKANPMTFLANLIDRTFRSRYSRRVV
ncbi:MAG: hypothetical protein ACLFRR_06480 [Spirochaetaceae bacterium]